MQATPIICKNLINFLSFIENKYLQILLKQDNNR